MGHVLPLEQNPAAAHASQSQQKLPQGGLAAARLTHHAQRPAPLDLERNAVHRMELPRRHIKLFPQLPAL